MHTSRLAAITKDKELAERVIETGSLVVFKKEPEVEDTEELESSPDYPVQLKLSSIDQLIKYVGLFII